MGRGPTETTTKGELLMRRAKPGRPEGAKTANRAPAISLPAACPTCGSTRREPYREGVLNDQRIAGEIRGHIYNRVVWRNTRCADCGQSITVREFLFEPDPAIS